mgnify:CR=1 FL=1
MRRQYRAQPVQSDVVHRPAEHDALRVAHRQLHHLDQLAGDVEPVVRCRDAMRGQIQGAGLGLGLARTILGGYGGSLGLESTEGAGTCVRLALPAPGVGDSAEPASAT